MIVRGGAAVVVVVAKVPQQPAAAAAAAVAAASLDVVLLQAVPVQVEVDPGGGRHLSRQAGLANLARGARPTGRRAEDQPVVMLPGREPRRSRAVVVVAAAAAVVVLTHVVGG